MVGCVGKRLSNVIFLVNAITEISFQIKGYACSFKLFPTAEVQFLINMFLFLSSRSFSN